MIRGSRNITMIANNQSRGVIKFPVVQELFDKKVCGIFVSNEATGPMTYGGVNAIGSGRSPIYVTLYDSDNNDFIYEVPAGYFSTVYGQPVLFRPRILNLGKCYLKMLQGSTGAGRTFFITVFYA